MSRPPDIREVLVVAFEEHVPPGREQEGRRPAVVVGLPERVAEPRFPMLVVVPLTTRTGPWSDAGPRLYPRLLAGTAGLTRDSTVQLDNIRVVDVERVRGRLWVLTEDEYAPIRAGLATMLDLGAEEEPSGEAPA